MRRWIFAAASALTLLLLSAPASAASPMRTWEIPGDLTVRLPSSWRGGEVRFCPPRSGQVIEDLTPAETFPHAALCQVGGAHAYYVWWNPRNANERIVVLVAGFGVQDALPLPIAVAKLHRLSALRITYTAPARPYPDTGVVTSTATRCASACATIDGVRADLFVPAGDHALASEIVSSIHTWQR